MIYKILILTPDSTGSTYFQRSLTLYLNYNNIPCKNYTDISKLKSLSNIVNTLSNSELSIIGRVSPATTHKNNIKDDHLAFCNYFFKDIFVIDRCSFESTLSYSIAKKQGSNIYSKKDYLEKKYNNSYDIPTDTFIQSLKHFEDFYVWVDKYFPNAKKINHSDLIYNTENLYNKLFDISDNILSLKDYNIFNMKRIRNLDTSNFTYNQLLHFIDISDYLDYLIRYNFITTYERKFPFKKITLSEKIKDISNFTELLDVYNNYPSNHFEKISFEQIKNRAMLEDTLWTI
jgi:hypothetical protein